MHCDANRQVFGSTTETWNHDIVPIMVRLTVPQRTRQTGTQYVPIIIPDRWPLFTSVLFDPGETPETEQLLILFLYLSRDPSDAELT